MSLETVATIHDSPTYLLIFEVTAKDYKATVTIITTVVNFTNCSITRTQLTQQLTQFSGDSIHESTSNIFKLTFFDACMNFFVVFVHKRFYNFVVVFVQFINYLITSRKHLLIIVNH